MVNMAEAERIIQAGKKKALDMNLKVGISVVDARGDLVAMVRLDGAQWRTVPISRGKAFASVAFGVPSAELSERANNPVMRALMHIVVRAGAYRICAVG